MSSKSSRYLEVELNAKERYLFIDYMDRNVRKPVFRVSYKARLKQDPCSKFRYDTFQRANNKGADQSGLCLCC